MTVIDLRAAAFFREHDSKVSPDAASGDGKQYFQPINWNMVTTTTPGTQLPMEQDRKD